MTFLLKLAAILAASVMFLLVATALILLVIQNVRVSRTNDTIRR